MNELKKEYEAAEKNYTQTIKQFKLYKEKLQTDRKTNPQIKTARLARNYERTVVKPVDTAYRSAKAAYFTSIGAENETVQ